MSNTSYLTLEGWNAEGLEVQGFPGIGFSLCAAATFNHIQGISDGGYKLGFPEGSSMEEA